jgi:hypothetical protein
MPAPPVIPVGAALPDFAVTRLPAMRDEIRIPTHTRIVIARVPDAASTSAHTAPRLTAAQK